MGFLSYVGVFFITIFFHISERLWKMIRKLFSSLPPSHEIDFSSLRWEEVGEVDKLWLYPCKSARGISLKEAKATFYGLADGHVQDRSFLTVTSEGRMVTGRQAGMIATVTPSYDENFLTLTDSNGQSIRVNLKDDLRPDYVIQSRVWRQKVSGIDCGDEVAEWLSVLLFENKNQVRLIFRGDSDSWDKSANPPKYFEFPRFKSSDKKFYADTSAYMIASSSSLEVMNQHTSEPIAMENFRPNIVVKGTTPFDEDDWNFVKIGEAVFRITKPCERCVVTCIDPATGERKKEPLATLMKFRLLEKPERLSKVWSRSPIFGMNCGIDREGILRVGDKVLVSKDTEEKREWTIRKP